MSLGACNCCQEPPCAEPVLQAISVTGEACGFALPDHPDNTAEDELLRFGTRTSTAQMSSSREGTTTVGGVDVPYSDTGEYTRTYTETIGIEAGECVEGEPSTSDVESYYELTTLLDGRKWPETTTTRSSTSTEGGPCTGTQTVTTTFESDPPDPGDTVTTTDDDNFCYAAPLGVGADWIKTGNSYSKTTVVPADDPFTGSTTFTDTVSFSDPVTDVLYPDYPAWPGESEDPLLPGQGNIPGSASGNGTKTKSKWRVVHEPSGTCYLKVWVRSTFTPAATTPPADPLPEPTVTESVYEWTGTGNPCLADPELAVDHEDNRITGTETEVLPPEELGEVVIELLKFSCVEGYEPDLTDPENPQPNGYPDPTWEATPP